MNPGSTTSRRTAIGVGRPGGLLTLVAPAAGDEGGVAHNRGGIGQRCSGAYEDGAGTFKEVAERFSVGEASVNRWVSLKRRTGSLKPSALGGFRGPTKYTDEGLQFLRDTLAALPGSTLQELCDAYEEEFGVRVHTSSMHEWVRKRLGMTRKRGSASRRSEIGKTSWRPAKASA